MCMLLRTCLESHVMQHSQLRLGLFARVWTKLLPWSLRVNSLYIFTYCLVFFYLISHALYSADY